MNEQILTRSLAGLPVPHIRYYETAGSTNDLALEWLENGAVDGSLVAADTQTAGRGRMDRRWVTRGGAALAFSLILRPTPAEAARLGLFSPLAGLAVCLALQNEYGITAKIKWPNDVLIDRRKVCGILAEAAWDGAEVRGVVIGVGVNVSIAALPPAAELLFPATSVEAALGEAPERAGLLRAVLAHLFNWRKKLSTDAFLAEWDARLAFKGEAVRVEQAGRPPLSGRLLGVAPGGELRVLIDNNEEVLVTAGDVHLRPADENA